MKDKLEIFDYWSTIPEEKIVDGIIVYAPDLLLQASIFMIGTVKLKYILPNKEEKIVQSIIVNDLFKAQSRNVQDFFIAHEIGHIKNKDLDIPLFTNGGLLNKIKYQLSCRFTTPDIEKEADKFAVSVVGKENAIAALENVAMITRTVKKQIERRIKIIKSM